MKNSASSRKKPAKKGFIRHPAVKFRRKVYVGHPRHKDALDKAFAGMSEHAVHRVCNRIADGKEELTFGFACEDGSDWIESDCQFARKLMYGFD